MTLFWSALLSVGLLGAGYAICLLTEARKHSLRAEAAERRSEWWEAQSEHWLAIAKTRPVKVVSFATIEEFAGRTVEEDA